MTDEELKALWKREEDQAHIHGWDFSHIENRYESDNDLPWDYKEIILRHLTDDMELFDYDTGGGEFLLSLNHPADKTSATEGYPPNVALCEKTLPKLGVKFKECHDAALIPFDDASFDMVINRHGSFSAPETFRILKKGGLFVTEQIGADNDFDLVKRVLPDAVKPYPELTLDIQRKAFEQAGFHLLDAREVFRPIVFYDIGAFVWFARIIEWEFAGFSVDACFEKLLELQREIERNGKIEGTIHRILIVAEKQK